MRNPHANLTLAESFAVQLSPVIAEGAFITFLFLHVGFSNISTLLMGQRRYPDG